MLNSRLSLVPAASTPIAVSLALETDAAAWNRYLESNSEATQYHRWEWRGVFERAFGHKSLYLIARRDTGVVGVLPIVVFRSALFGRFMVSLPFVYYGGVVCDDDAVADALLAEAASLGVR